MNTTDHNHNHDPDDDPDDDRDNDNGQAVLPASTGGALTALEALATALANVDTSSVAGRSGLPLMTFKAREADGASSSDSGP